MSSEVLFSIYPLNYLDTDTDTYTANKNVELKYLQLHIKQILSSVISLGLYDKPVVIVGKRARKSTDFLVNQTTPTIIKESKPLIFEVKLLKFIDTLLIVITACQRVSYLEQVLLVRVDLFEFRGTLFVYFHR